MDRFVASLLEMTGEGAMRETAFAKVNLALHVRAREPSGYHRIETIFAFAQDGDELEASEPFTAGAIELDVTGPFAADLRAAADNLVTKAAERLRAHYRVTQGVRLRLDKRLPVASGIGGGSADAAAALRLLTRWWGLPDEPGVLHQLAPSLGADVPACLVSRSVRGEGRGDELREVKSQALSGTPILLVNPLIPLSTAAVFARWDGLDRGPLGPDLLGRNDLEAPARSLAPVIGDVLEALAGALFVRMSGSGATCFGLYEDEAARDAAAVRIERAQPHWWTLRSGLR
jgi:4-diphosphocytidyl-2-C-methyl-D-erythritol kinase